MIHVEDLIVPIPIKIRYEREKRFQLYPGNKHQLMDKNKNPIEVYWEPEQTKTYATINYNDKIFTYGELYNKFASKEEYEFPYRGVQMQICGNDEEGRWLSFSFEAMNKNVFDNIYFAIRDWLCKVFECEPFIF